MIALIQRVSQASVEIGARRVGAIGTGVLALIGVCRDDSAANAERLLQRLLGYRIFPDPDGRMNLSLTDTQGGLLLVPQFTLAARTDKGMRPSFASAAGPAQGRQLFELLLDRARRSHADVASGEFGADMAVALINDGPVTFWIEG